MGSDVAAPTEASHVNFRPGSVDPNLALAPIGTDGAVCFVDSVHASVHLVADLLGMLDPAIVRWPTSDGTPTRRLDTRLG